MSNTLSNLEADMLEQSRQIRRTAKESYRAGKVSLLEFLDARRLRANRERSLYAMEAATG